MSAFARAFRGELVQLRKWPAVRWLVLAMPVYILLSRYLLYYLLTVTANPEQVLPSAYGVSSTVAFLAPGQLIQVVGEFGYQTFGPVLALVLGALVVGSGLERGTTRSAALTGAGWWRVLLAQGLAVCTLLAVSVVATYGVSAGASELAHLALGTPVPSTVYAFPKAEQLAHAVWIAMLISVCYGMIGCALAAIVQTSGTAIILGLFLIYGIEYLLNSLGATISAVGQVELYEPADSVFTLTAMFGQPGGGRVHARRVGARQHARVPRGRQPMARTPGVAATAPQSRRERPERGPARRVRTLIRKSLAASCTSHRGDSV
jgi:hypothetical protein